MADNSKIEWTDATWNPITGCSVVSPGCTNCYAMRLAGTRHKHIASRAGLTRATKAGPVWTGETRLNEGALDQPLRWRAPRKIFVCAHGDLFAESVPDAWIDKVFAVMALCPQHTFQVLTKRPERMLAYLTEMARCYTSDVYNDMHRWSSPAAEISRSPCAAGVVEDCGFPLPNVWLGVSVEDQRRADERIPVLLDTPAAVRWISAEPLLGPVDLLKVDVAASLRACIAGSDIGLDKNDPDMRWPLLVPFKHGQSGYSSPGLDWVVAGGESGPRPMHPDWARSLRDQCADADVPFLLKQWGSWAPTNGAASGRLTYLRSDGTAAGFCEAGAQEFKYVGKKAAGRMLDGVTHDGFPELRP